MAITVETVANVVVRPDLSAFTQATEEDVATVIDDVDLDTAEDVARHLLAQYWIIPR